MDLASVSKRDEGTWAVIVQEMPISFFRDTVFYHSNRACLDNVVHRMLGFVNEYALNQFLSVMETLYALQTPGLGI